MKQVVPTRSSPERTPTFFARFDRSLRFTFVVAAAAALLYFVATTWHWPMIQDSAVMHYVIFLIRHGFRPYRDITDMNMPGTYMLQRAAMAIFGGSDLAWRVYDFFLLAVILGALTWIARPYDWLAGVFAGGLFALRHGTDGLWFTAEREQEITALIALSCAFLFAATRRHRPPFALGFGLCAGVAASIKPTLLPFCALALLLLWFELGPADKARKTFLLWALAGLLAAFAADLLFLVQYNALRAFFFVLRTATPAYAGMGHPGRKLLLLQAMPLAYLPLFALAIAAAALRRKWNWEKTVLLLAMGCGLFSYFAQGKGFPYHRYLFLAFALLLSGLELLPRWEGSAGFGWLSRAALLLSLALVLPRDLHTLRTLPSGSPMTTAMEADLRSLDQQRSLQDQVQCFDLILGCLNSLYHLDLVENTAFTGDLLLFPPHETAASQYYRSLFWQTQAKRPAGVLVMTNEDFGHVNSFRRVALWPEFDRYLNGNYRLLMTRSFPTEGKLLTDAPAPPEAALAYRIYVRRGTPFDQLMLR